MKNFICIALTALLPFSLNASTSSTLVPTSSKGIITREHFIEYLQKLLGPRPSLRMFTGQPHLPRSLFLRHHFAEVEEASKSETTLSYKLETKASHGIGQTSYIAINTTTPYSMLSARTSLNIDSKPQEVFLAIRNTLSTRSLPLLHHSRDYAVMNFEGGTLYDGTFECIKMLVSSLQMKEPPIAFTGAKSSSAPEDLQIISEISVKHGYSRLEKPHAIALITTTSKEALCGKVLKEAPKQTRYLFDVDLASGNAVNIPAPGKLTFEDVNVNCVYDPTGIWVSAASSVLHVLRLDIDSLTFTTDYTINISVPRPHSESNASLGIQHLRNVIMRDGKPDYLGTSSNGNGYISLLTGSKGNNAHFLVSSKPSLVAHHQFFGQNLDRKVTTFKELRGSDFPVPFTEDLTTGIVLPTLTPTQLSKVGRSINCAFSLDELQSHFPEAPSAGNAVLVTTKAAPKTVSLIFGDMNPQFKKRIEEISSLKGKLSISPKLDAYIHAEKSAGINPNSAIELHKKDRTSIRYSIVMNAPVSPVDFCELRCAYPKPMPGIYLHGRRETEIVFLHIHGGPHTKTSAYRFNPFAQYLASFGPVVDINYPGSKGLSRVYESYSDGNWSGVADLLAEIAGQFAKSGKKVVAVGTSFGAYATMKIANQYPDLLAGAIAINGLYDLHYGLREEATMGSEVNIIEWTHQFGGADGDEILNQNSVIFGSPPQLANVKCPTLLVSGEEDRICSPAQTEKMFAALAPSTTAYHLHSKTMGHSHKGADNVIITSVIGPFLHAHVSKRVVFEPFPEAITRLAAKGNDLGECGLPGWSLTSNIPGRREMLDAELNVLGAVFH